jgi:flagellar biosynthetic protein FliP
MFNQVDDEDLALFVRLADQPRPETRADVPTYVLIPAFLISELKTAFQIGFLIFIPFLIIDMVVASTLMSMGMIMLPPVMISLPFKILLFVLVDGWSLTIESLVVSFGGGG